MGELKLRESAEEQKRQEDEMGRQIAEIEKQQAQVEEAKLHLMEHYKQRRSDVEAELKVKVIRDVDGAVYAEDDFFDAEEDQVEEQQAEDPKFVEARQVVERTEARLVELRREAEQAKKKKTKQAALDEAARLEAETSYVEAKRYVEDFKPGVAAKEQNQKTTVATPEGA